jgi:hypothetical protein
MPQARQLGEVATVLVVPLQIRSCKLRRPLRPTMRHYAKLLRATLTASQGRRQVVNVKTQADYDRKPLTERRPRFHE